MALVYSYIRFSSARQAKGDSLRRQLENGERWVEANEHTAASLTLRDMGVSAFRGANKHGGALKTFLDAIESGKVKTGSILLVEHLDRLSRQGIHEALPLFLQILNAGVKIAVLKPQEHLYEKPRDPNEALVGLLLPLVYFHLAHIESLTKSERLRDLWDKKRTNATDGEVFDRRCPSWVSWDETNTCFVLNDGANAVRAIFDKTIDGCGQHKVLEYLQENFKPIGTSGRWNASFIQKVLNDRTVLGERQPHELDEEGGRVAVGDPIPNYYPAAIDEPTWYRARASKAQRRKQKGRNGQFVNLFKGLVTNANDGKAMHIQTSPHVNGGRQRRFVSYGHKSKESDSCPLTVEYHQFERTVLDFLVELDPAELVPSNRESAQTLADREQELIGYMARMKELETQIADPEFANLPSLLRAVKNVEERRDELEREIEQLKQVQHRQNPLEETKDIISLLKEANDEQGFRLILRSNLARLLESIWVKPEKYRGRIYSIVQLVFHDGGYKHVALSHDGSKLVVPYPESPFENVDYPGIAIPRRKLIRGELEHLPAESLMPQWDLRTPEGQQLSIVAELEKQEQPQPVPDEIPDTLGEAAAMWLVVTKNRMNPQSYRVVPSKIERFVRVIGSDQEVAQLGEDSWRKWIWWLRTAIRKDRLATQTARVNYNRAKEFIRWLVDEGQCEPFDGLKKSAASALPASQ